MKDMEATTTTTTTSNGHEVKKVTQEVGGFNVTDTFVRAPGQTNWVFFGTTWHDPTNTEA